MLPPNSSISSSEAATVAGLPRFASSNFSRRRLLGAAGYFVLFLACFELAVWFAFTKTPLAHSSLRNFLWYGASYEYKLRTLVDQADLPPDSVLYAGWLRDGKIAALPLQSDVTIYGMSFSRNLGRAMAKLRPELTQRQIGGPGAPMNHTYAAYQEDRKTQRHSAFAVVGLSAIGVEEATTMNRGSLYIDAAYPYFYPRYKLEGGRAVLAAESLINSADELRAALVNPAAWERQLTVLADNDGEYRRFFFASDILDGSVLARFVRRGMSTRRLDAYSEDVLGPRGFRRDREAPQLVRALLRQMLEELRAENIRPIVFLVSTQGTGNALYGLVDDILREEDVPYVNTEDDCRSDDARSYLPDLHFTLDCDAKFAARTLAIIDAAKRPATP
jgi:hypothetical protein